MIKSRVAAALLFFTLAVSVARSGHELPIYPSYYPHEIRIETAAPERAAALLARGRVHAQIGSVPSFGEGVPQPIRAAESLGSFVIARLNPSSTFARSEQDACAAVGAIGRDVAGRGGKFVFHPYPVTPFHADYLHHVDLATAAKTRLLAEAENASVPIRDLKVRAEQALATRLGRPHWQAPDRWDAEIVEINAADLVASAMSAMNGWLGPPWLKAGWFHAHLLLSDSASNPGRRDRIERDRKRLQTGGYEGNVERINLERDLVTALVRGCRNAVLGYTVKREYFTDEFSAGIENIAYDSLSGLNSPIFIRTVKLKDFPWNGWLVLGIDTAPAAAWNPIAGFSDEFGRLMWSAIGDPALLPTPYGSSWMFNRISDVQATPRQ